MPPWSTFKVQEKPRALQGVKLKITIFFFLERRLCFSGSGQQQLEESNLEYYGTKKKSVVGEQSIYVQKKVGTSTSCKVLIKFMLPIRGKKAKKL
jgi:hypothetical protein